MHRAAPAPGRRTLRCAVYTRKSSEDGLEQEFNSLHAQREACEAFIKSQRHEGWVCLPHQYNDGGFSGATMQRPGLQLLLADIQADKVDVIVTYKVDRLTRSLADFAKIVEVLDTKGASFVSVTQQFNTTTSMGRLTLNVLLSFAQFEREVTGERIRDKIAASKRKGLWMGGMPPLGYAVQDRKLMVVENEAETVRHIFRRYAALGSVRLLQDELAVQGIRSKSWVSRSDRRWGGRPLARGALYSMLQNRIYRGEIVHKDQHYPGEHPAIIDERLWNEVQARLAANAQARRDGHTYKSPSLLAGLLFDAAGHRMTPTHAVKNGARYRYYVSRPLIASSRMAAPDGMRIPASEIENVVLARVARLLSNPTEILGLLGPHAEQAIEQRRILKRAGDLASEWPTLTRPTLRQILQSFLQRVAIGAEAIDLHIVPGRLLRMLKAESAGTAPADSLVVLSIAARLRRVGQGLTLIAAGPGGAERKARIDARLVRLIASALRFRSLVLASQAERLADVAANVGVSASYFTRILRLSFLAPNIVRAILDGHQPAELTVDTLVARSRLLLAWSMQRHALGFS
jgi:DNA invertase Pin-like site-specific DNA recombinase